MLSYYYCTCTCTVCIFAIAPQIPIPFQKRVYTITYMYMYMYMYAYEQVTILTLYFLHYGTVHTYIHTYLSHFLAIFSYEAPCFPPLSPLGVSSRWLTLNLVQDVLGDLPENLTLNQPLTFNVILIQTYMYMYTHH